MSRLLGCVAGVVTTVLGALVGCGPGAPREADVVGTWVISPDSVRPYREEGSAPRPTARLQLKSDRSADLVDFPPFSETARALGNTLNRSCTWTLSREKGGDALVWVKVPAQGGQWMSYSFGLHVVRSDGKLRLEGRLSDQQGDVIIFMRQVDAGR